MSALRLAGERGEERGEKDGGRLGAEGGWGEERPGPPHPSSCSAGGVPGPGRASAGSGQQTASSRTRCRGLGEALRAGWRRLCGRGALWCWETARETRTARGGGKSPHLGGHRLRVASRLNTGAGRPAVTRLSRTDPAGREGAAVRVRAEVPQPRGAGGCRAPSPGPGKEEGDRRSGGAGQPGGSFAASSLRASRFHCIPLPDFPSQSQSRGGWREECKWPPSLRAKVSRTRTPDAFRSLAGRSGRRCGEDRLWRAEEPRGQPSPARMAPRASRGSCDLRGRRTPGEAEPGVALGGLGFAETRAELSNSWVHLPQTPPSSPPF